MKINRIRLAIYLARLGMSEKQFFEMLDLDVLSSVQIQLGGDTLNEECSRKFLNAIGAEDAIELINWEAMNVRKPRKHEIFANAY